LRAALALVWPSRAKRTVPVLTVLETNRLVTRKLAPCSPMKMLASVMALAVLLSAVLATVVPENWTPLSLLADTMPPKPAVGTTVMLSITVPEKVTDGQVVAEIARRQVR
jgi:hypothetical protein